MTSSLPRHTGAAWFRRGPALILAALIVFSAAACNDDDDGGTGPAPTGTVAGTITSSLGGPVAGITVTATPTNGTAPTGVATGADGKFSIAGVPVSDGKGTLSFTGIPANCTDPGSVAYTGLTSSGTVTKDVELTCHELVGTVSGTVTSSLGGPLADVEVTVDPDGDDAAPVETTTDADGKYSVTGLPVGAGSVSITDGLPDNCTAPSEATYEDLEDGGTETVDFTVTCAETTGALKVTVLGLLAIDAAVNVSGPDGFDTTLTATATLADLAPGSYTVTADSVVVDDSVVDSRFLAVVVGGSATVEAGDTATATVTYAIRTGSGGLWFSNTGNSTIARLAAGQLHASGSPVDTTNITVTDGVLFAAFDRDENLWTSTAGSNELSRYTRDQLVAGETPTSQYTLISAALVDPRGIAFDAGGNVWVANSGNGTIVKILKQYLDVGGTSPAAVTITLTGIANPTAIAFDAAGSLWITDRSGNQVAELDATQLTTTATVVPNTILGATGGSLNHPQALAFDASGNLWVANDAPEGDGREDTIVGFGSTLLDNDGAPTPSVTITLSDDADPYGLAFDESGSLWVSLHGTSQIVSFTATQLSDGGDLTPTVTITAGAGASLNSPSALVFDPHALGLPIR